ncbi:MAG: phosphoribosyltransferase family protein [Bacteroidales bacterium]
MTKPLELIQALLALFYPRLCNACGKSLLSGEECICTFCQFHLPQTHLHEHQGNKFNQIFWGRVSIETATALYYYQKGSKVQHLIHQLKYRGKKEIGHYLGTTLGHALKQAAAFREVDLIIPVPLHAARQRQRGFNQSEVFGQGIAHAMNIPLVTDALIRAAATATQTRKTRFRRWQNVETVFQVTRPDLLKNKNLLLVDDVVTTGATLEASATKLLEVPGVKVWIATIAMVE